MESVSQSMLRYGSQESPPDYLTLNAGPLTMAYAQGALRYIRLGEEDVLLQVYAAVRDHNWGTILPRITLAEQTVRARSFRLRFRAEHQENDIHFVWDGTISGHDDGTIHFEMDGEALSTFLRNRIGFCILHPMSCAGRPCLVESVDGQQLDGQFPLEIAPHQPYKNIRALTHEVVPGLRAEVRMEGDTFEMEDQRNWTDASYKTYCTPLDLPYPVRVEAGTKIAQRITIRLHGAVPVDAHENAASSGIIRVTVPGRTAHPLPLIGLGSASHGQPLTAQEIDRLRALKLAHLRVDVQLSRPDYEAALVQAAAEARALAAGLEIAVHLSDAAEPELAALRESLARVQPPVSRWLIFHKGEKSTTARWVQLARQHLAGYDPNAPFGAGTDYFFTELNRERPPLEALDFVTYSINPQVHAFDNDSLVEALKPQAVTVASARAFAANLPVVISPVTLKMRANPNATGPEPVITPGQLPPQVDVRQMSLFGAGWTLGSLKYLAESGAHSLTYYETSGWRGVMETAQGSPLRDQFPALPGAVFPLYHVLADVGEFAGGEVVPVVSTRILAVDALALRHNGRVRVLLANFTAQNQAVHLPNARGTAQVRWLDDAHAPQAMRAPETYRALSGEQIAADSQGLRVDLPPFAVARIDGISLA